MSDPVIAVGWAGGVVVMAGAAAVRDDPRGQAREPGWSLLAVPIAGSFAAVVLMMFSAEPLSLEGYIAGVALLLAVGRLAISLVDNQRAAERRHREEAARLAREEAERANRAKTEFLSRMSHEVRTPLNSILGFAQLLVDDVHGEERASVERILRAGNHLQQLIDDILDLSSIEAGETVVKLEPVAIGPVIDESVALLEPLFSRTGTRVVRRDEDDAPAAVIADAQRLKQVLLNLISNAAKYGGNESEVVLQVRRRGDLARIAVVDSGPGIPDEHLPRLFHPFERGSARGSGIEGSGLGLALTKNLVEAMNGSIAVDTGPDGTTFSVALPAADIARGDADGLRPDAGVAAVDSGGARTALYIEDHASNIELVERLLARRGDFELVTALTGHAGLKLASTLGPDVILLDLDLPDMRGEDVLAELRFDEGSKDIPVIVVSADATGHRQEQLLRAGASAYVVKPIQLASFMATLDAVVGRSARTSG